MQLAERGSAKSDKETDGDVRQKTGCERHMYPVSDLLWFRALCVSCFQARERRRVL
jgi:hypothetical protein